MKLSRIIIAALAAVSLVSCVKNNDDNSYSIYSATVTFRLQEDGSYYLKQDDTTALLVLNPSLQKFPFKTEKRALVQYLYSADDQSGNVVEGYKRTVDVTLASIDTMMTLKPVKYAEGVDMDKTYGKNPVGLVIDKNTFPTTMVEDGYLNLCLAFKYSYVDKAHDFAIVSGVNPADPYELELRHKADPEEEGEYTAYDLISCPLKDLPDTGGKTVKLTLKWKSLVNGEMNSTQFDYCSRTDW